MIRAMRDVIVAANWKMHTTPADAGDLARTIAARTRGRGRDPGDLPAVRRASPRSATRWPSRTRTSAIGAQNVHHELQGAYTGEISAPMLAGLATWVIVGHSERRRDAGETDELIGRKLGRAIEAGLRPILCVGEQLAEREAGDAGRRRPTPAARRAREPRPGAARARPAWSSPTSRSGRSARAATRAAATRRRWPTRSGPSSLTGLGRAAARRPSRSCTAAASPRPTSPSSWPSRRSTARSSAGASLKPDEMAGIVARAGLTAARPRRGRVTGEGGRPGPDATGRGHRPRPIVLVVLDGFGIGGDPAADAIAAAPMPTWRALLARLAARRPRRLGGGGRPAAGPDGQLGGRPPEPRCRPAGPPGPAADRRGDRRRLVLRAPGAPRGVPRGRARRRRPSPRRQPRRAGRRPRQRPAPRRAGRARRVARACPRVRVHALLDGRDTPPSIGPRLRRRPRSAGSRRPIRTRAIATVGGRYFAMDRDHRWDRVERGYDAIVHGVAASTRRARRRRSRPPTPAARTTSSWRPTVIDGVDGIGRRAATRSSTPTSAPIGRAS